MSPKKKIRAIKERNLPDCEWRFEPFLEGKPDWAVRWCWEWEFSRNLYQENEAFKAAVANWRKARTAKGGLYHAPDCATLALSDEVASKLPVVCFPSWPLKPFCELQKSEWDQLEMMETRRGSLPYTPSLCDVDRLPDGQIVLGPEGKSVLVWGDYLAWVMWKVEWEYQTDEQVLSGFKEWLKQARSLIGKPTLMDKYNGEMRRLHKELKQLGFYRFRMGYNSHLEATIALGKKGMAISQPKLSEAVKVTEAILEGMFHKH